MDFGYFTFPLALAAIAFALYFYQETRHGSLEKGRSREIKILVEDLTSNPSVDHISKRLCNFISEGFTTYHDVMMPIRMYTNYRRISIYLAFTFLIASGCAFFKTSFNAIIIPKIAITLEELCISLIWLFTVLTVLRIWDEFSYTSRIIKRFDDPNGN